MTLLILERNLKLREGVAGIRIFQMHPKEKNSGGRLDTAVRAAGPEPEE